MHTVCLDITANIFPFVLKRMSQSSVGHSKFINEAETLKLASELCHALGKKRTSPLN